jgi:hypothetical protein
MSRAGAVLVAAAVCAGGAVARDRLARWGATDAEVYGELPGDEFVLHADRTATRAVTVYAPPDAVWPWIAQLGQGRGGFYSYDGVENLLGMDIHSADRVVPEWQSVRVGTQVRLAAEVPLMVAVADPDRALVLRGSVAMGAVPVPYDFTWAFVLHGAPDGDSTRLVVRESYGYLRWWAPALVEPMTLASFVMSRRMLQGIRERAERP